MKKNSLEYIKKECNLKGFKLVNFNYINTHTKIHVICSCGNLTEMLFNNIKKGHKCQECSGNKKFNIIYIKKYFKNEGYICTSDKYINKDSKLDYICLNGHTGSISFGNFKNGHRCMKCRDIKNSGSNNRMWNPNREQVELNKKIHIKSISLLKNCLKSLELKKNSKTEEMLGYTKKQLLEHLQKDPNFDKWKEDSYNWHIDHIFPIKAFVENNIKDPKIINNLDNLRIISRKENRKKSDNYNKELFSNKYRDIINE